MSRISSSLTALVLAGSVIQIKVGPGIPVSALILLLCSVWFIFRYKRFPFPVIHWSQALFISAWGLGLWGACARPEALKETVQLCGIMLVSPWLFRNLKYEAGEKQLADVFSRAGLLVLALYVFQVYAYPPSNLSAAKTAAFCVIAFPFVLKTAASLRNKTQWAVFSAGGVLLGCTAHHGWVLIGLLLSALLLLPILKHLNRPALAAGCVLMIVCSFFPVFRGTGALGTLSPFYKGVLKRTVIELKTSSLAPRYLPFGSGPGEYLKGINRLRTYTVDVPHPEDQKVPEDGNCQYSLTLVESGAPASLFLMIMIPFAGAVVYLRKRNREETPPEEMVFACAVIAAGFAGCFSVILSRGIGIWVGALIGLLYSGRTRLFSIFVPVVFLSAGFLGLYLCNDGEKHISEINILFRKAVFGDFRETERDNEDELEIIDLESLTEQKTEIRVEAESCVRITDPLLIVPANEVSGGKILRIPVKAQKGKGFAVYQFDIPEDGTYTLQADVLWRDGCSNSLKFEISDEVRLIASDTFKRWHTLNARKPLHLYKGRIRAVVYNIETGISLDFFTLERTGPD